MSATQFNIEMGHLRGRAMVKEAMVLPADIGGVVLLGLDRWREQELQKESNVLMTALRGARASVRGAGAALRGGANSWRAGMGFSGGARHGWAATQAAHAADDVARATTRMNPALAAAGGPSGSAATWAQKQLPQLSDDVSRAAARQGKHQARAEAYAGYVPPKPAQVAQPKPPSTSKSDTAPKAPAGTEAPAAETAPATPMTVQGFTERMKGRGQQLAAWGRANPGYAALAAGGTGLAAGAGGMAVANQNAQPVGYPGFPQ